MKYALILIMIICGGFFASCQSKTKSPQNDSFYTNKGGYDYVRVPLIEPYEAVRLNGSKEWIVNLKTATFQFSVSNVRGADVTSGLILLHNIGGYLKGSQIKEAWFILIPSKHLEMGFSSYTEFVTCLHQQGVKQFVFKDIEDVYLSFNRNEKLEWNKKN